MWFIYRSYYEKQMLWARPLVLEPYALISLWIVLFESLFFNFIFQTSLGWLVSKGRIMFERGTVVIFFALSWIMASCSSGFSRCKVFTAKRYPEHLNISYMCTNCESANGRILVCFSHKENGTVCFPKEYKGYLRKLAKIALFLHHFYANDSPLWKSQDH